MQPRKRNKKLGYGQITVGLPTVIKEHFRMLALSNDMRISEYIVHTIRKQLKENPKKKVYQKFSCRYYAEWLVILEKNELKFPWIRAGKRKGGNDFHFNNFLDEKEIYLKKRNVSGVIIDIIIHNMREMWEERKEAEDNEYDD